MNLRESFEEREFQELSPYAAHSRNSRGRDRYEPECDIRTVYQRDRDRILHSKAFRRMKDKTQVFLAAQGDHYRTRLTHTLEVSQIARTIARALNLNEDLTEAIALGHDLGHTPFGHSGEASMLPERGWSVPEKPFDVFLSFNFLEHQPRPDVMLKAIWNNLAEDGMGLVTVPSLEYILEKESYYELIRDHIAYYTFDTLRALLNHCGFEVLEEEMINRDTLSMIVRKTAMPEASAESADDRKAVADCARADAGIIAPLMEGHEIVTAEVRALTGRLAREGKRLAMWGASHQGFTLASTSELGKHLAYIIDSAPFKQGRFAPASHVPIVPPDHYFEEPVDAVLIVAPGYTDEIAGIIKTRFGGKVEIMTLRTNRIEHL